MKGLEHILKPKTDEQIMHDICNIKSPVQKYVASFIYFFRNNPKKDINKILKCIDHDNLNIEVINHKKTPMTQYIIVSSNSAIYEYEQRIISIIGDDIITSC